MNMNHTFFHRSDPSVFFGTNDELLLSSSVFSPWSQCCFPALRQYPMPKRNLAAWPGCLQWLQWPSVGPCKKSKRKAALPKSLDTQVVSAYLEKINNFDGHFGTSIHGSVGHGPFRNPGSVSVHRIDGGTRVIPSKGRIGSFNSSQWSQWLSEWFWNVFCPTPHDLSSPFGTNISPLTHKRFCR